MKETTSKATSVRPRRTPIGVRNRLSVPNQEPGFVYRVVNVIDDRVTQMQEQGYEIVENVKVGDKRVDVAGALGSASEISVGRGMKAIVMRQREDWYKEDQAAKQSQVDSLEQSMKEDLKKKSDYGTVSLSRG